MLCTVTMYAALERHFQLSEHTAQSAASALTAHHAGKLLHHFLHLIKLLGNAVYLTDIHSCALCDALFAGRI